MGRAMLIIVTGLMVALGYTFMGMASQKSAMTSRNANTAKEAMARNMAHTGVQFALYEFKEDDSWRSGQEVINGNTVKFSLDPDPDGDTNTEIIEVTSTATIDDIEHTIVSTFDISQQEGVVPAFNSALGIATDHFEFGMGGNADVNGNDQTGDPRCSDSPGISVTSEFGKDVVGTNSGIDGVPDDEAAVDEDLDFKQAEDLIQMLEDQPAVERLRGNYKGDMGSAEDPGIFFVEENVKLSGGIKEGYGIMVIRTNGKLEYEGGLDVKGNFTFNGLVIFQNAFEFDAAGTPTINGSILVGNSDTENLDPINIRITGNVDLQYDCTAKDYADLAVQNNLNLTLYQQKSIYE